MQEIAGHATSAVAMGIYTHVNMGSKHEAAKALRRAMAAARRQSLYLRFLCFTRAVCSGVWLFAACFRFVIPEVQGKIEIRRADPGFMLLRPAVLLTKIGLCSGIAYFSPHFRNMGILAAN